MKARAMNEISSILQNEYGILAGSIAPATGGFSAKAYRAVANDGGEYFVKVYDKFLPTTRFFVERIDQYMPVLEYLSATPALRGRVLTPVRAQSGAYKAETPREVYALFLFVHGGAPGIEGVTLAQTVELAQILARLHETKDIPFDLAPLAEDILLLFCGRLARFLDTIPAQHGPLRDILAPHADMLRDAIGEALRLRDTVRAGYAPLVLCHGDAHGNNIIQSERLVLADWEDLRVAPPEADLFIHAWHPHGAALLSAYAAARPEHPVNAELLRFYVLRRRIEDVWVDVERLTEEAPSEAETARILEFVRMGVGEVRGVYEGGAEARRASGGPLS